MVYILLHLLLYYIIKGNERYIEYQLFNIIWHIPICNYPKCISITLKRYTNNDDDDIRFICTKIGPYRPLRSCGKIIIIK